LNGDAADEVANECMRNKAPAREACQLGGRVRANFVALGGPAAHDRTMENSFNKAAVYKPAAIIGHITMPGGASPGHFRY